MIFFIFSFSISLEGRKEQQALIDVIILWFCTFYLQAFLILHTSALSWANSIFYLDASWHSTFWKKPTGFSVHKHSNVPQSLTLSMCFTQKSCLDSGLKQQQTHTKKNKQTKQRYNNNNNKKKPSSTWGLKDFHCTVMLDLHFPHSHFAISVV